MFILITGLFLAMSVLSLELNISLERESLFFERESFRSSLLRLSKDDSIRDLFLLNNFEFDTSRYLLGRYCLDYLWTVDETVPVLKIIDSLLLAPTALHLLKLSVLVSCIVFNCFLMRVSIQYFKKWYWFSKKIKWTKWKHQVILI